MMFDPIPNLSDETLIETVRFPTILRNALISAGLKTIGEIRASPDNELGRITRIGKESLTYLRRTLGRADRGIAWINRSTLAEYPCRLTRSHSSSLNGVLTLGMRRDLRKAIEYLDHAMQTQSVSCIGGVNG
jgi:hypothetical protein